MIGTSTQCITVIRECNARINRPSDGDADDVFFDDKRHRIYVSCGDGVIDVLQQDGQAIPSSRQRSPALALRSAMAAWAVQSLATLAVAQQSTRGF
jgi:hypothetical protein